VAQSPPSRLNVYLNPKVKILSTFETLRILRRREAMSTDRLYVVLGAGAAITITATMDAHGLTVFSALPLFPLAGALWALQRFSRAQIGLTLATWRGYAAALGYPAIILSIAMVIAFAAGATHARAFTPTTLSHMLIAIAAGTLVGLLTEEGFFRGWLWAALARAGLRADSTLVVSSIIFALWHVSYVTMAQGYILPLHQVLIFIPNAFAIGVIWGTMRSMSGSIIVSSVSHSVWNAFAYLLFGEGPKVGLLGITQTSIFGAEVGVVGLALNCAFALALLFAIRKMCPAVG
jgi:uncharacterized protein